MGTGLILLFAVPLWLLCVGYWVWLMGQSRLCYGCRHEKGAHQPLFGCNATYPDVNGVETRCNCRYFGTGVK